MPEEGLKKWFMLQVWRIQQVAQVITIVLLAVNLSLQLYTFMEWREGSVFATPYTGATLILLILAAVIWAFAIFWDLRLKMWREQATVLVERNPYVKEKMSSKEIALTMLVYLPLIEKLGKDDPSMKVTGEALRAWLNKALVQDANTSRDLDDLLKYIGTDRSRVFEPRRK